MLISTRMVSNLIRVLALGLVFGTLGAEIAWADELAALKAKAVTSREALATDTEAVKVYAEATQAAAKAEADLKKVLDDASVTDALKAAEADGDDVRYFVPSPRVFVIRKPWKLGLNMTTAAITTGTAYRSAKRTMPTSGEGGSLVYSTVDMNYVPVTDGTGDYREYELCFVLPNGMRTLPTKLRKLDIVKEDKRYGSFYLNFQVPDPAPAKDKKATPVATPKAVSVAAPPADPGPDPALTTPDPSAMAAPAAKAPSGHRRTHRHP